MASLNSNRPVLGGPGWPRHWPRRFAAGWLQLVQRLTGFDRCAFTEELLLHDATHLGPDLGNLLCLYPARQNFLQALALRWQGHHAYLVHCLPGRGV